MLLERCEAEPPPTPSSVWSVSAAGVRGRLAFRAEGGTAEEDATRTGTPASRESSSCLAMHRRTTS